MMTSFSSVFSGAGSRPRAGFSLIEVTLALGIVTFALVGAVGVLPTALASSRQSFNKNRAAAIADSLFASFRSQWLNPQSPQTSQLFNSMRYLDVQFDGNGNPLASPKPAPLDLNTGSPTGTNGTSVQFYATVLDGYAPDDALTTSDPVGTQRHLRFAQALATPSDYLVTLYLHNQPDGAVIAPQPSSSANGQPIVPAQANQIEMIVSPVSRPTEQYHFVSTVVNRTN